MRCSSEVCHLAKSTSQIPINMKLAQVKLFGDIYTSRPAEKQNVLLIPITHGIYCGNQKASVQCGNCWIKALISFWMFFTVITGTLLTLTLFLFLVPSQVLLLLSNTRTRMPHKRSHSGYILKRVVCSPLGTG